jgi:hypothetical protein
MVGGLRSMAKLPRPIRAPVKRQEPAPKPEPKATRADRNKARSRNVRRLWAIGLTIAGIALLAMAGMIIRAKLKTPEGDVFIVLEIDQPGAEVLVDGDRMTVQVPGDEQPIEIKATPGRHQVQVRKNGFEVVSKEVELATGKSPPIKVRLEPVQHAENTPKKVPGAIEEVPGNPRGEDTFVSLFNGRDLSGWKTHPAQPGNWRVENGILIGRGPARSHLYTVRDDYKDFHLRVEVRINEGGNSGLHFRAGYGPSWPAGRPQYPMGYEAQVDNTASRKGLTGSLFVGANGSPVVSINDPPAPCNQWFTQEVIACGNHIIIKVDGRTLTDYIDEARHFSSGHIALQSQTPETVCEFRRIQIKELSSAAPNAAEAPRWADRFVPLFNGRDLSGWKTHPAQPGNWRVENGILIGSGPTHSHLYTKRGDYADFHLRLEMRINQGGNTGVYFRAPYGPTFPANNPQWLAAYNAKIDLNRFGGLFVDGGPGRPLLRDRLLPVRTNDWITLEVIAQDNHLVINIDGVKTLDFTDQDKTYSRGHIVLQKHGGKTVAEFRKIEIRELPQTSAPGMETRRGASRPSVPADRVQSGSVWKNDQWTLTILEHTGTTFRARFQSSTGGSIREVKGTVEGDQLSWRAREVRALRGNRGGDNFGTIKGDHIDFTYRNPDGSGGTFQLARVSGE